VFLFKKVFLKNKKREGVEMNKWRHSKRGFTLMEIMVMVTMIAVLALLGFKLYNAYQERKAKNTIMEVMQNIENFDAIVRINCKTIQTLIFAEMADSDYKTLKDYLTTDDGDIFFYESGIQVPGDGLQTRNGSFQKGWVVVAFDDALERFLINGNAFVAGSVFTEPLTARY